jgi:DNA-binding NarL/FixJ family response regulator
VSVELLELAARALEPLLGEVVFLGGASITLWITDPGTDREPEVAAAVGQGNANAEIAAPLDTSVAAVGADVSRLVTKLDVDQRVPSALIVQEAIGGQPGRIWAGRS